MKRYKFLREGLKSDSGSHTWEVGQWYETKGEVKICENGFHCSKDISQAFSYVKGEILALVEVKGSKVIQEDKECWGDMRIVKAWKWQKKDSVAISIYAAELCLKNFEKVFPDDKRPREAIEAAKKWLENPTSENESAARSAESAAWSAESAAKSAAKSAESAAESAWSAAKSAAKSAWSAAESAWSAESAARSAAWSAWSAESAAKSAWSAESARTSTLKKISKRFDKQLKQLEPYGK